MRFVVADPTDPTTWAGYRTHTHARSTGGLVVLVDGYEQGLASSGDDDGPVVPHLQPPLDAPLDDRSTQRAVASLVSRGLVRAMPYRHRGDVVTGIGEPDEVEIPDDVAAELLGRREQALSMLERIRSEPEIECAHCGDIPDGTIDITTDEHVRSHRICNRCAGEILAWL